MNIKYFFFLSVCVVSLQAMHGMIDFYEPLSFDRDSELLEIATNMVVFDEDTRADREKVIEQLVEQFMKEHDYYVRGVFSRWFRPKYRDWLMSWEKIDGGLDPLADQARALGCGHVYHRRCLEAHAVGSKKCACCVREVVHGETEAIARSEVPRDCVCPVCQEQFFGRRSRMPVKR